MKTNSPFRSLSAVCLCWLLLFGFLHALDAQTPTPTPTPSPAQVALDELAKRTATEATIATNIATLVNALVSTNKESPKSAVTTAEKVNAEVNHLAYSQLHFIGSAIARAVARTERTKVILIGDKAGNAQASIVARQYRQSAKEITAALEEANKPFAKSELLFSGSASTGIGAMSTKSSFLSLAAPVIEGGLAFASLFKSTYDVKGVEVSPDTDALLAFVGATLLANDKIEIRFAANSSSSPLLTLMAGALKAASVAESTIELNKNPKDDQKTALATLKDKVALYHAIFDPLLKGSPISGIAVSDLLTADSLIPEQEDAVDDKTAIVYIKPIFMGGDNIGKTNGFGAKLVYAGCAIATFRAVTPDGRLLASDTYYCYKNTAASSKEPFTSLSDYYGLPASAAPTPTPAPVRGSTKPRMFGR